MLTLCVLKLKGIEKKLLVVVQGVKQVSLLLFLLLSELDLILEAALEFLPPFVESMDSNPLPPESLVKA